MATAGVGDGSCTGLTAGTTTVGCTGRTPDGAGVHLEVNGQALPPVELTLP